MFGINIFIFCGMTRHIENINSVFLLIINLVCFYFQIIKHRQITNKTDVLLECETYLEMYDRNLNNEGRRAWLKEKIFLVLDFICSFLEMHLIKIVSFSIMYLCCEMVNALHTVVVVVLLMSLIFGYSTLLLSFSLIGPYLGVLFLSKMVYQTKFFPEGTQVINCSIVNATFHSRLSNTILDPVWWGYETLMKGETLFAHYKVYFLVFLTMTLQVVIRTRQKIVRIDAGESPSVPPVMFKKTTRKRADKNLKECFKYLINYGFYKFGIEITLSYCVILIAFRMDVFSVLYAVWVFILFLPRRRKTLEIIWPFFFTTLLFSILWQYTMAVGLSPKACFDYPWAEKKALTLWMFLPSFQYKPDTSKTLADFCLLLFIQRQQSVFELERRYGDKYLGGSNKDIYKTFKSHNIINPTPNHTFRYMTWINIAKFIFMTCFLRITLAFLFWNGASNVNILSLGYLVGAFVFLWIDYDLCLWPIEKILRWWNALLGFIIFVILFKSLIEFIGCLYGDFFEEHAFWMVELFCINCHFSAVEENKQYNNLLGDVICFICVIFQRRYFKSYYYLHEIDDVIGIYKLQEKGAKLIDKLQEHKLKQFQERERKTLMKIKKCMNRIKAWQRRMQGLKYKEPEDHTTAIYMGDYFMFENLDSKPPEMKRSSSSSDEYDDKSGSLKYTVSEFLGTVFKRQDEGTENSESKSSLRKRKKEEKDKKEDGHPQIDQDVDEKEKKGKRIKNAQSLPHISDEKFVPKRREKCRKNWQLFLSIMADALLFLIRFLKNYSKDYRYIQTIIKQERKKQKYKAIGRILEGRISSVSSKGDEEDFDNDDDDDDDDIELGVSENKQSRKESKKNLLMKLINALNTFIMSKTEFLCYVIIFLHTVLSPTLLSLPLPILVFFWGSLTSVRPTTTFWTVLIAYTEVTVVIKALFQNSFFPWNTRKENDSTRPGYPPLFLGIHRDSQYVMADLFLLLLLFLHRYKLKTLGLWNRAHELETLPPQDLYVYNVLDSEKDLKNIKRNRSAMYQRKILIADPADVNASRTEFLRMAIWKCTSRVTAKLIYRGNRAKTKILVKEIEGKILVTHEGRRLQPTYIHASLLPEDETEGKVVLRVYTEDAISENKALPYKLSWIQHFTPLRKFFVQVVVRDWRLSTDFYTLMFIFEFLDFLIVFFGYSSFIDPVDIESEDYFNLMDSQVPPMYLFTLMLHFFAIIVDRILYLRKNVIGKFVLQVILVILIHVWMFIIIPIVTESSFNHLHIPQTYYIISSFYFLMSAYQLRVGYPVRVQGHFLCNNYGHVNYYAYKGLQFIPFFNQLRTLLDYLCTHSSLSMTEWIKMESIFELVYENKCCRRARIHYPLPRGKKQPKCHKYFPGILAMCGLMIGIWLPFIIFVFFKTVAQPNLPQDACLEIYIGNFGKIYNTRATFNDIITFTESQYKKLQNIYKENRKVWSFLSVFDNRDVGVLKFRPQPYMPWSITPQEFSMLNETVQNLDIPVSIYLTWIVERSPRSQIVPTARGHREIVLKRNDLARQQLASAFINKATKVQLDNLLPKFIHVTNEGIAKPLSGFFSRRNHSFLSISLTLVEEAPYFWWKLEEIIDEEAYRIINKIPHFSKKEITLYTFNQKNIPKYLLNVSKKGIIGLYLSTVIVLWTFMKSFMTKYPYVMYTDMPNPDPVLKLCKDIYLARESHEFALEEDLYAKLLFLFRSPETMIKVTRLESSTERA